MAPQNFYFGGGASGTLVSPFAVATLILVFGLMFLLPRKYALVPVLFGAFLIPQGNVVVVAGAHFAPSRLIALEGLFLLVWVRLVTRRALFVHRFNSMDVVFSLWAICHASAFVLLWKNSDSIVNQAGFLLSSFGIYFLLRYLIRDDSDIYRVIKILAFIVAINALGMCYEQLTQRNLFEFLGGVSKTSEVRGAFTRAQGTFQHPILAGVFGATLMPLFILLWKTRKSRVAAVVGFISSTAMVIMSFSTTPVLAYVAGIAGISFWPMRRYMRALRWELIPGLAALQLIMKEPLWYLIDRADVFKASSGHHRAMLVDNFIRKFGDWWLVGTKENAYWGREMWDTSNQYVQEGERGGLITFALFIALISVAFGRLGKARKAVEGDRNKEWFFWLLGVALFANVTAFFGVAYWDQTQVGWVLLLVMIGAATAKIGKPEEIPESELPFVVPDDEPEVISVGTGRNL